MNLLVLAPIFGLVFTVVFGKAVFDPHAYPCMEQPRKLSTCGLRFQWYYAPSSKRCFQKVDDTCPGFNRFQSYDECYYRCIENEPKFPSSDDYDEGSSEYYDEYEDQDDEAPSVHKPSPTAAPKLYIEPPREFEYVPYQDEVENDEDTTYDYYDEDEDEYDDDSGPRAIPKLHVKPPHDFDPVYYYV